MLNSLFSKTLVMWYLENKRDLPWRNSTNPYKIWLSEIILQQTRVSQGLPYFLKFFAKFPTIFDLASASEQEILKLWQGLGYYSRARNLHATAKTVVDDFNGDFPSSYKKLINLKGVGIYTASAIASFSSNEPVAVVDGNVYRVLSRIFGIFTPINSSQGGKEFKLLADSLLNFNDSATHNQAIMEFGALHCLPKNPKCISCPFIGKCFAFKNNSISELPVKTKKIKVKKKYFSYYIIEEGKALFLSKRKGKGIWQGLYEFPLYISEEPITVKEVSEQAKKMFETDSFNISLIQENKKPHKLSHQHIYACFYKIDFKKTPLIKNTIKTTFADLDKYPIPVLISNFLKDYSF